MSMSLIVGRFTKKAADIIDAEYEELCKSVYVTEYIDEIISDFTESLTVFEQVNETEYEEIIYKTILMTNIRKLLDSIDDFMSGWIQKYDNIKGKTEKEDIVNHIKNLISLNFIVRETLYNNLINQDNEKLIYLIIA